MKKILFLALSIMLTTMSFGQNAFSKEIIVSEMDKIGQLHNEALDYYYVQFKNANDYFKSKSLSNLEKIKYMENIVLANNKLNPLYSFINDGPTYPIFASSYGNVNSYILDAMNNNQRSDIASIVSKEIKLSVDENVFLERLLQIVDKGEMNIKSLEKEIALFNDDVFNKFGGSSNSTYILIGGSSVAKYSINYWFKNSSKWQVMSTNLQGKLIARCKTGRADVTGAVSGGVAGAIGGSVVGGVGALPGAVVGAIGGGLGGSLGEAVGCLLDWLWD